MRAAVTCLAVLALLPGSAQAAGWVTGPPVSAADRFALSPLAAVGPSGDRIVAWSQQVDADANEPEGIAVRVAPPGGDFGPQQLFASEAFGASLVEGGDGTAALVWIDESGNETLHIARRAPGQSTFTEAFPLSLGIGVGGGSVAAAVQDGNVYVAYRVSAFASGSSFSTAIRAAHLDAGSTLIQPLNGTAADGSIAEVSSTLPPGVTGDAVDEPDIAVGAGTIHVAWDERVDISPLGHTNVFDAARPIAGTTFAIRPVDAVASSDSRADDVSPQLASQGGQTELVWLREEQHQIASDDVTAGAPVQTTTLTGFPFMLFAGLDPAGPLLLTWAQPSSSVFATLVDADVVTPGVPGPGPATLTDQNTQHVPQSLSVAPDGNALALIDRRNDGSFEDQTSDVQASVRPPGGGFGDVEEVSGVRDRTDDARFDLAAAAMGPGGVALAAWSAADDRDTLNSRIFVSQRDATAPVIGALTVPASVAPGTPVALAASVSDTQSGVSVDWDLGDGSAATGPAVSHAYGAPGVYTVTARATDGVGNVATRSATLTVAVAASPIDRTAPQIAGLKTSHARFRVGAGATATIAKRHRTVAAPAGTAFTMRLDERATLVLTVTGKAPGRRSGSRCVPGRATRRRCTAAVSPGTLIRSARGPGAVKIAFSGRVGSARLVPGSYVLSATAIDAAGNRSLARTVAFTVVAR